MWTAVLLGRYGPRRLACLARRLPLTCSRRARYASPVSESRAFLSSSAPEDSKQKVRVTIVSRDGLPLDTWGHVGDSLLDVVVERGLDIDGFGACEGTLACSTCHVIFPAGPGGYGGLTPPSDEEMDMLDLAFGLTDTSRLGCQVCLSASMDGIRVQVPSEVADIRQLDSSS